MIFEILTIGGIAFPFAHMVYSNIRDGMLDNKPLPAVEVAPVLSPEVELTVELLKANVGWKANGVHFANDTGVAVHLVSSNGVGIECLWVKDDAGDWQKIDVTTAEKKVLSNELKAFRTREESDRRRQLSLSLAKRVAARESGAVRPVLGGSDVPEAPGTDSAANERSVGDALSAGSLTYDHASQRIVVRRGLDNEQVYLTKEFADRYAIYRPELQATALINETGRIQEYMPDRPKSRPSWK